MYRVLDVHLIDISRHTSHQHTLPPVLIHVFLPHRLDGKPLTLPQDPAKVSGLEKAENQSPG